MATDSQDNTQSPILERYDSALATFWNKAPRRSCVALTVVEIALARAVRLDRPSQT